MNKAMEMIERVSAGEDAEDVIAGRTGTRVRKTLLRAWISVWSDFWAGTERGNRGSL